VNRSYTFEEVFDLDDTLYKLALYEVNKGKMSILTSHEELMDVHLECAEKFNYFKDLIQSGECTLEYLKDTVLFKNGPYHQYDLIDTPEKLVDRLDSEDANRLEEGEDINSFYNKIGAVIQSMSRAYEEQEKIGDELQITDITNTTDIADATTTPKPKTKAKTKTKAKRPKKKKEE